MKDILCAVPFFIISLFLVVYYEEWFNQLPSAYGGVLGMGMVTLSLVLGMLINALITRLRRYSKYK
jgi:uncharacterized membrane protein